MITRFVQFLILVPAFIISANGFSASYTESEATQLPNKDVKIAVIGAGASGLTAAYTLLKRGYKRVTVFEKEGDVGGKVFTYTHNDLPYELGAIIIASSAYKTVMQLVNELGISLQEAYKTPVIESNGDVYPFGDYVWHEYPWWQPLQELANLYALSDQFPIIDKVGFFNANPELFVPFSEFIKKYDIEALANAVLPFSTGCGYGYYEEVPALYLLRFNYWMIRESLLAKLNMSDHDHSFASFSTGFRSLWREVAKVLPDVRLNTPVTHIERFTSQGQTRIKVSTQEQSETYDHVILSTPFDINLKLVKDLSSEEQELFSKVQYYNYYTTLFQGEAEKQGFLKEHMTQGEIGKTMAVVYPHPEQPVAVAYQLAPPDMSANDVLEQLKTDIKKFDGEIDQIIVQKRWRYFPHVSSENLKHGFYDQLEELQGRYNTYYVGGIMNFETVEDSAAYAQKLIMKKF